MSQTAVSTLAAFFEYLLVPCEGRAFCCKLRFLIHSLRFCPRHYFRTGSCALVKLPAGSRASVPPNGPSGHSHPFPPFFLFSRCAGTLRLLRVLLPLLFSCAACLLSRCNASFSAGANKDTRNTGRTGNDAANSFSPAISPTIVELRKVPLNLPSSPLNLPHSVGRLPSTAPFALLKFTFFACLHRSAAVTPAPFPARALARPAWPLPGAARGRPRWRSEAVAAGRWAREARVPITSQTVPVQN